MDMLSRVLSTLRLRSQMLAITEMGGDANLRTPGVDGFIGFHYVIEGECRIYAGGREHRLVSGEFGLFSHGTEFRVAVGREVAPVDLLELKATQGLPAWSSTESPTAPHILRAGTLPYTTRLFNGLLSLDNTEAELLAGSGPIAARFGRENATLQGWVSACLNFVIHECAEPRPGFTAVAGRALELLLTEALRDWVLRDQPTGWVRGFQDPRIRRALQAIYEQPSRQWTLQDLARIAGQSRSGFAETFVALVGETAIAHLTRWRMHLAARRLREGLEPVASIAESLGYASSFAFSRAFRLRYQNSPGAYRKKAGLEPANEKAESLPPAST